MHVFDLDTIFGSLGRILICLDDRFRVVHAANGQRHFLGKSIDDVLGDRGTIRRALLAGERVEESRVSAAPLRDPIGDVKYVVVIAENGASANDADRILAALESTKWRRDFAANKLG